MDVEASFESVGGEQQNQDTKVLPLSMEQVKCYVSVGFESDLGSTTTVLMMTSESLFCFFYFFRTVTFFARAFFLSFYPCHNFRGAGRT